MKRSTKAPPAPLRHSETATLPDGRTLDEGDEFSLVGGGRFRFLYEYLGDGSLAAFGPIDSPKAKLRAFRPERVKTVHRTTKSRY